MKRDIKFNVYGSDELKDELKYFVDMYLTDTYISSLMDTVDSSEVTHVEVDLQDNILNITLYGSIDEEGYEQYSAWYNGKFHYTNGKQKDFSFWVD